MSNTTPVPTGPPWSIDDIADVHAGVYPADITAGLRASMLADPDAAAVLAALDGTVDQLSLLPAVTMPSQYADRLTAAIDEEWNRLQSMHTQVIQPDVAALLAAGNQAGNHTEHRAPQPIQQFLAGREPGTVPMARREPVLPPVLPGQRPHVAATPPPAPVADLQAARERSTLRPVADRPAARPSGSRPKSRVGSLEAQRRKRRNWTTGLLAAAAVAAAGAITITSLNTNKQDGVAAPITSAPAPAPSMTAEAPSALKIERGNLADAFEDVKGTQQRVGGLANPATWLGCLGANKVDPASIVGVSSAEFEGAPAYAIAVNAADGKTRMVIVGVDCGPNKPATLDDQTFTK